MLCNCRFGLKKTLFKVFALVVFCCSLSSFSLALAPTAVDVYASTLVSTSISPQSVQVVLEGADFDSTTLTYGIVIGPNSGILSGIVGQSVTYTPNDDFVGSDVFTYKVNDGSEDSPINTVTVRVFEAYLDNGLQQGIDIDGEASGDQSGRSVALSSDGSILAVGAPINNGSGSSSGHVRVYKFRSASGVWLQLGADINGEAANDESGRSLALSSNGYTLALAAPDNTGNATRSGHVRVYRYNDAVGEVGAWGQLGGDIDGEGSGDQSGQSIALSSDGNVLVVGTPETDANSSGHVSVYYYDEVNRVWTQVGADIDGESEGDQSGSSVDASSDGLTVAVGSIYNNGAKGSNSGHVRVYQYDGSFWLQLGSDIDGEASGDQSGYSVSLSSDGKILAVGAPDNGGNGLGSGHVRVYKYNDTGWVQLGADIDGEADYDASGYSVALSSNGLILAVGAPKNNANGVDSGHVRVYQYNGSAWTQLITDIDGEVVRDDSGHAIALSSDGLTLSVGAPFNDGNGDYSGHTRVYQLSGADELPPEILTDGVVTSINEGDRILGTVVANEAVFWSIAESGFAISAVGVVTLSSPADYETRTSYSFTITATDIGGNTTTTESLLVNVIDADEIPPVIILIGDVSVSLELSSTYTDSGATATDNFDGSLTESIVTISDVDTSVIGEYTVTYSVTDAAGNAADQVIRTVTMTPDVTPPVISLVGFTSISHEVGTSYSDAGATATDNTDGLLTERIVTVSNVNASVIGVYTVSYNVSDASGNTAIAVTRTVVVQDTGAPVITLLGDASITLEAGDDFTDAGATATDAVDGNQTLTANIVVTGSVNTNAVGTYILTYNVSDESGNAAIAVIRTIEVVDTGAPVLTLLGDAAMTLEVGDIFTDLGATAADTVDGDLSDSVVVTGVADTSAVGTYTLTYNVSDDSGNAATAVTRVVAVQDTGIPVINLLGDASMTLEVGDTFTDAGAIAIDAVDGGLSDDIVVTGLVDTSVIGSYMLSYNVSDASGNAATAVTRTIEVVDTGAPVITLLGDASMTLEVGDTFVDAGAIAIDSVDGDLSGDIVVTGLVDTSVIGSYMLSYNVSDASGNTAIAVTRTVVVQDTGAPVITLLGDASITLEVGDTFIDAGATAIDAVDGGLTDKIVVTGAVDTSSVGLYTLTYNVSDNSGNVASAVTREIAVQDTGVPVLTLLGDANVTLEFGVTYLDKGAVASDNNDGDITALIVTTSSVDTQSIGTYAVTYNVSDAAGNAATTITRSVTVIDVKLPIIIVVGAQSISLELGTEYIDAGAVALDDVDGDITSSITTVNPVDVNTGSTYTITYNVTDAFGNLAITKSRTVVITTDSTIPVITLLGEATVSLEQGTGYNDAGARASDVIDGEITSSIITVNPVDVSTVGTYKVSYNVSDAQGNSALEVVRTVTVTADVTKPLITLLGDASMTLEVGDIYIDSGAKATDLVDDNQTLTANIMVTGVVNTSAVGTYILTYSVNDLAGNTAQITRTVSVVDTGAPVITLLGDASVTLEVGETFIDAGAMATDAASDDQSLTARIMVTGTVNTSAVGTYTLTYTVNDESGNAAAAVTRTVMVVDTGAPVITLLGDANVTLDVGNVFTDAGAVAIDAVDGGLTDDIVVTGSVDTSAVGAYTLTYNVIDSSGNAAIAVARTILVVDTGAPVITLLGDTSMALEVGDTFIDAGATARDAVDDDQTLTANILVIGAVDTSAVGTYVLFYNVRDRSGNAALAVSRTVVVQDTGAPVITLLGDASMTLEVGDIFTDSGATATDAVDGDLSDKILVTGAVESMAAGTYVVTYNVTDSSGNVAFPISRLVTVIDVTPPEITLVGNASVTLEFGATYLDEGASASDNNDGDITAFIVTTSSVDTRSMGTHTVIYNVKDAAGNAASPVIRSVKVVDSTAPEIIVVGAESISLEFGTPYTDAGAVALDDVDGDVTSSIISVNPVDVNTGGTYIVTYSVSDASGNVAIPKTRTVVITTDTTTPVITLLGEEIIRLEQGSGYIDAGARASDIIDGELTSSINTVNPVDTNTIGTYKVTYNVTDLQGNSAVEVVRMVTVTADITKPVITLQGDAKLTLEVGDTFIDLGATALDALDGDLTDDIKVAGTVDVGVVGTYVLAYSVSDSSGNTAQVTRTITITPDVTIPVISLVGDASVSLELGNNYTDLGATATDNLDGTLTASIVTVSNVDDSKVGTYTVSYYVTDAAGNTGSVVIRTVTITPDVTIPVISLIGDASISMEVGGAYIEAGAVAVDSVDDDLSNAIVVTGTVNTSVVGIYVLAYNVSDTAGNAAAQVTRALTITADVTNPVISLLGDASLTLEVGDTFIDSGAMATDAVDGSLTANIVVTGSVDTSAVGIYTLAYNVSDDSGNAATSVIRTVVVQDTSAPVITLLGDTSMTLEVGDTFTDAGATATDAVDDDQTLTANIVVTGSVNTDAVGIYTLTYTLSDAAGNAAKSVTRTVVVQDTVIPVIILLGDASMTLEVGDIFTDLGATASDAVDGVLTDEIVVTGSVDASAVGTYTLTYNVKDKSGNAATALIRSVDVEDTGAPVITMLGDVTMTLVEGDTFTDPGVTAIDAVDGSLTDDIVVTGSIDTSVVDTYILTYNVADAAGNLAEEVSRTVVIESFPIVLVIPDDLTVNAVGFVTGVDLDPQNIARATNRGDVIDIVADKLGPFESGSYEIVWSATSAGRSLSATQILSVRPLAELGTNFMTTEGNTVALQVFLSGQAPDYPVTIPFNISGTAVLGDDYSIEPSESVIISEGILGSISLSITADEVAESQEDIVITLGEATSAALGVSAEQVITVVEENLSPRVVLTLSQADVVGSTISKDSGTVTVYTNIIDANQTDTHTVTWARALQALPEASVVAVNGEGPEFPYEVLEFDPAGLEVGVYSLAVDVSDGVNDVSVAVNMNLIAQAPVLSEESDSDGDGISDADEGAGDLDGDGIPDYLDNLVALNLIPVRDTGAFLYSEPGTKLILGMLALGAGDNNISITEEQVIVKLDSTDTDFDYPHGLIDFELTGADFGYSYLVVLPMSNALADDAVYRKYSALGGWGDFVENATNTLSSGMKIEGTCPELGSDSYTLGLTTGDDCVQLMIEEGGPNDADGLVNGTLVDPGGFAIEYFGPPSELSEITLSRSQLTANGTDRATITVIASDSDGRRLENMTVSASVDISGIAIGAFIEFSNGIYTATLTAGNLTGSAAVVVVIDDGEANISLASEAVAVIPIVVQPPGGGGGCTVATDGSRDASLLLLLMMAGLLVARRRNQ